MRMEAQNCSIVWPRGSKKLYKCFPTEIVAVQGISVMTNGEEVVYTITSKMEGRQWGILYIRSTTNQQSWVWKEGILWTKWVLSAGGKWDVTEWLHDSQALFTLKQLLTSSSPHRQAQRRDISVWKPLLSCCHLLLPGPARILAQTTDIGSGLSVYPMMPVAAAAPSC